MKQHSPRFLNLVSQVKPQVREIAPVEVKEMLEKKENFFLIDVREESEWQTGHLPRAIHISRGILERDIEKIIPDTKAKIVVYCSGGFRGCLAAYNLSQMGYENVFSLQGGSNNWEK